MNEDISIVEKLNAISVIAWIDHNEIKNEAGIPIRIDGDSDYFFLFDIYADTSDIIASRKPSQFGLSTWAILTSIHDAKYGPLNQIHTLPTQGDVNKFVSTKVEEIIEKNPDINKMLDTISRKEIGKKKYQNAYVYYAPTFSEKEGFIITSDRNWYDEVDRSKLKVIKEYDSRLEGAHSLRQKRYLSTPTIPGFGIDKYWEESDQKHWRFTCGHCNKRQHMVWPDNVDMKKKVYICSMCGKEIDREWVRPKTNMHPRGTGKWEAKYPKRSISGYWFTQMIAPWVSAADLIKAFEEAEKENNLEYFYNHKLGMPYVSSHNAIGKDLILRNCLGDKPHIELNSCMGVDVQLNELWVAIGTEAGVFALAQLPETEEKSKWERLGELMEVYDVRYCVIDGGFTPNEVIAFANKYPGRVWINWYKDDPKKAKIVRFSDDEFHAKERKTFVEEITVLTERDRMIDYILDDLKKGVVRFFYYPESDGIKKLIAHTGTTYARIVTDRMGRESREWVHTGKDDLFHALIYYRIARMKKERAEK